MGSEEVNARVHVRAAFQHGLISFKQLLECGVPRATVSWRVRNNELKRVFPGVYVIAGTRLEWMQWLSAAVLWAGPGAAVAGRAAAELLKLDAVGRKRLEIAVPHDRNPLHPEVIVHRTHVLTPEDLSTRNWPPRTNIGRTLVDLSAEVPPRDLERALDSAWRQDNRAIVWALQALNRLGLQGRGHAAALHELLTTRLNQATDSDLEALLLPVFRDSGLPTPLLHYNVEECPWFAPEIDFAWPHLKVGVQADGFKFHSRYRRWLTDMRIRRYLDDLGWQIVAVSQEDVLQRPWEIVESVRIRMGRTFQLLGRMGSTR